MKKKCTQDKYYCEYCGYRNSPKKDPLLRLHGRTAKGMSTNSIHKAIMRGMKK